MARQADNEVNASQPNSKDTIRALVLEFLGVLPEAMKRMVHFSAIPNAFTPELIQLISGETAQIAESLELLH